MALATQTLLRSLGAEDDPSIFQDGDVGVRMQIGPHALRGGQVMSWWLTPTYRISGVIKTERTVALVDSEMPVEIESEDEGLAWLAAILRGSIPQDLKPDWLLKGECLRHLLPRRG